VSPDITLTAADYARAEQMLAPYRARRVPTVAPQWLDDGERFHYVADARNVLVDPHKGERCDLFDHERLAAALSLASGHAVEADAVPLTAVEVDGDEPAVRFSAFGQRWRWAGGVCTPIDETPPGPMDVSSPDGRWIAFDEIVLPSQTLRLVDALVAADKDVDLLIIPGGDHAIVHRRHHLYRRTWDHLVRHLHGTEPPAYRLAPLPLPF
jgi:hypothetical protein